MAKNAAVPRNFSNFTLLGSGGPPGGAQKWPFFRSFWGGHFAHFWDFGVFFVIFGISAFFLGFQVSRGRPEPIVEDKKKYFLYKIKSYLLPTSSSTWFLFSTPRQRGSTNKEQTKFQIQQDKNKHENNKWERIQRRMLIFFECPPNFRGISGPNLRRKRH